MANTSFDFCTKCDATTLHSDKGECVTCAILALENAKHAFLDSRKELSIGERLELLEADLFEHIYKHRMY